MFETNGDASTKLSTTFLVFSRFLARDGLSLSRAIDHGSQDPEARIINNDITANLINALREREKLPWLHFPSRVLFRRAKGFQRYYCKNAPRLVPKPINGSNGTRRRAWKAIFRPEPGSRPDPRVPGKIRPINSCAGITCRARGELFVPKLQYFLSFKYIEE